MYCHCFFRGSHSSGSSRAHRCSGGRRAGRRWVPFEADLGAYKGNAFSLEPLLTQSAWFRGHNRDDKLKNFYLVGAGTHPGAGIPGVVGSAKATAKLMMEELR